MRPRLLFFSDARFGESRRVEGFLAQVPQRWRNHHTFRVHGSDYNRQAVLARRCGVAEMPALVVVEKKRVQLRIERPRGWAEIRKALAPWLR